MSSPDDLLYTKEHEWIRLDGTIGTIGITQHAEKALGDVVYVEMPKVGENLHSGTAFGNVESVKAVSELFAPVSGEVIEINELLGESPETVNSDPYGSGWMVRVRLTDEAQTADLMSAEEYDEYTSEQE